MKTSVLLCALCSLIGILAILSGSVLFLYSGFQAETVYESAKAFSFGGLTFLGLAAFLSKFA